MNGLGAQGDPRGASVPNPVTYPFKGLGGVTVRRQTAGLRTWDINADGVAQYGLYPDWIQDLAKVGGLRRCRHHRRHGPRHRGVPPDVGARRRHQPDSCRNPSLRRQVSAVSRLIHPGMSTRAVMNAVGQPYTRLGRAFGFCAKERGHPTVRMTVTFTPSGKVLSLRRGR